MTDEKSTILTPDIDAGERMSTQLKERAIQLRWLLFSFKGRISIRVGGASMLLILGVPFLIYFVIVSLTHTGIARIAIPLETLDPNGTWGIIALVIAGFFYFWINWAVSVKRAHDFGHSWPTLVGLGLLGNIPYAGWIFALAPLFWKGDEGANKYGVGPGWKNSFVSVPEEVAQASPAAPTSGTATPGLENRIQGAGP